VFQLSVDPGLNSGVALGFYDATTPYQLIKRYQVHDGLEGFVSWMHTPAAPYEVNEAVVERFVSVRNDFAPDITGIPIEGVIRLWAWEDKFPVYWQTRMDKSALVGYPAGAITKAERQRVRFDFLKKHDLFAPGTENDDSNDAICHGLISLKRRKHMPTLKKYWAPKA